MKVLVVTNLYPPEFLGGYELGCSQMVGFLSDAGHDVRVVTSVSAHAHGAEEESVLRILEMPPIYSPSRMGVAAPELRWYFQLLASAVNPANIRALGEAIEEFDPDVAYLWNPLGLGGLGVLALLAHKGVPWVWHIMDLIPLALCRFGTSGPELGRELHRVFPGRYIACSAHVLGEIRAGGVELGDRVRIVPNWVHGESPKPRTEFFRDGELRILAASGILSVEKGVPILIEAAAVLLEHGLSNFKIDIYGREDDPCYRRMLYEHDVADHVTLRGSRHHGEMLRLYADYDLFAFPTWAREPFAFVGLEAAAAGCVPLISDESGNAEWMIDGVDCIKAPRSPVGFAEGITKVLNREVDLAALGRRAQRIVWRDFHISSAGAEVERFLAEAAAERCGERRELGELFTLATFAEGLIQALVMEAGLR